MTPKYDKLGYETPNGTPNFGKPPSFISKPQSSEAKNAKYLEEISLLDSEAVGVYLECRI